MGYSGDGRPSAAPKIVHAGQGTTIGYYSGLKLTSLLISKESFGSITMLEEVVTPGFAPPLHVHHNEDEFWYVLSGKLRFWMGSTKLETATISDVSEGGFVFGPRGIPHTYETLVPSTKLLLFYTPGGVDGYFNEIADTGQVETRHDAEEKEIWDRYGVEIVGEIPNIWNENRTALLEDEI